MGIVCYRLQLQGDDAILAFGPEGDVKLYRDEGENDLGKLELSNIHKNIMV